MLKQVEVGQPIAGYHNDFVVVIMQKILSRIGVLALIAVFSERPNFIGNSLNLAWIE